MFISVIIPVYNGEKGIEKAIQSVLSQERNDVEQMMESLCRQGGARGRVYRQLAERKMMLESMLSYFRIYAGMK